MNADARLKLQSVQEETVFSYGVNKTWAADHRNARSGTREETAEVSSDGTCSDDGNAGPAFCLRHVVVTEVMPYVALDIVHVRTMRILQGILKTAGGSGNRWLLGRGGSMALCRIRPELEPALVMLRVEKVPIFSDKKKAVAARW